MPILHGQLAGTEVHSYAGYRATLLFQDVISYVPETGIPDPNDPNPPVPGEPISVSLASELDAAVAADGGFDIEVAGQLQPPVQLRVTAPGGQIAALMAITPPLPEAITVEVAPPKVYAVAATEGPPADKPVSVSGRVVDQSGDCDIANSQLLIRAHRTGAAAADLVPIVATRTDTHGYFSSTYPAADYDAASVVVLIGDNSSQPVPLDHGLLSKNLLLVVNPGEKDRKRLAECGSCRSCMSTVPRAPTSEDLVNDSGTYAGDLGAGHCVNLTIPNRVVEEFSYYTVVRTTEPGIQGLTVADASSPQAGRADILDSVAPASTDGPVINIKAVLRETANSWLSDVAVMHAPGRSPLTASHPLQWEGNPTFYQASTIAHGHILHFKQVWNADGYSLGELLYSLPLAPCEKKQIAIVDWTRREAARRGVDMTSTDAIMASLTNNRDIAEILATALAESMRGASHSSTWGVAGGMGGAGSFGAGGYSLGAVIGVSGGGGGADSSAWQDSSKNLSANSLQQIRQNIMQAASSVRGLRGTVVQSVEQGEQVRAETSVVANHNHCHALTIEYFEVLRHYLVRQHLAGVQECLFVPLTMSTFDSEGLKALRWRSVLERHLKRPALAVGFDAIDQIRHGWDAADLPAARFGDERMTAIDGDLTIRFRLPRPSDAADAFDSLAWAAYNEIAGVSGSFFYDTYLAVYKTNAAEKDRVFREKIAPLIARKFVERLTLEIFHPAGVSNAADIAFTLLTPYAEDAALKVALQGRLSPALKRSDVQFVQLEERFSFTLTDMPPAGSDIIAEHLSLRYRNAYFNHALVTAPNLNARLLNLDTPGFPAVSLEADRMDTQELRNPRAEGIAARRALVAHLNEFIEYYHRAIWWDMDPERRYMLLDGVTAPAGDGRSVASVVENRLVGIVGNSLVMPLAPGFRLDPTYALAAGPHERQASLLDLYTPPTLPEPMRISVPTPGVFAEAVMGSCNSCEEIPNGRLWKFEEHPCGDQPTPIEPPSTATRRAEPGNLELPGFPAPIINLQNAPAVPDPTALAAALGVLGAASPFRDLAGLGKTQENAAAALAGTLNAAENFGATAAQLAQSARPGGQAGGKGVMDVASQQQAANNIEKTMRTIDESQASGHLSGQQAGDLKQAAIRQMIGSGENSPASELDLIKRARESGMLSEGAATELTNEALGRMVGAPSRVTESPGFGDLIDSSVASAESSVSYLRHGDAETFSLEKKDGGKAIPEIPPLPAGSGAPDAKYAVVGIDTAAIISKDLADTLEKTTIDTPQGISGRIKFVGRYILHSSGLEKDEVARIHDAGLKVFTIFEWKKPEVPATFDGPTGTLHAKRAIAEATRLGQTDYTPIYFAVDEGIAGEARWQQVIDYFKAIKAEFRAEATLFTVGVYGADYVLHRLAALSLADSLWQTGSGNTHNVYAKGRYAAAEMVQYIPPVKDRFIGGIAVDHNVCPWGTGNCW